MADREHGAIPQGLIEQARARSVDPGKLQLLGKHAAALHSSAGTSLTDSVVDVIGKEDLGPEHARRVCEFANQEAFKNEWEKGGSVRNVEFEGGPANPADVLRELNDGARTDAVRVASDYDESPTKIASANQVEEEIFSGHTSVEPHPSEVPAGMPDLARLRTEIIGAQDHCFSKAAGLEVAKEQLGIEFAKAVGDEVLNGLPMQKIAQAVSHVVQDQRFYFQAFDLANENLESRGIEVKEMEKVADVRSIPNEEHPLLQSYIGFEKTAAEASMLHEAVDVLNEQLVEVEQAMEKLGLGIIGKAAIGTGLAGAGIGALSADPGKRLQGAVRGGLVGGGIGLGAGYGLKAGLKSGVKGAGIDPKAALKAAKKNPEGFAASAADKLNPEAVRNIQRTTLLGGAGGIAAGAAGGTIAGQAVSPTQRGSYR